MDENLTSSENIRLVWFNLDNVGRFLCGVFRSMTLVGFVLCGDGKRYLGDGKMNEFWSRGRSERGVGEMNSVFFA